jgi:hypothetical protein
VTEADSKFKLSLSYKSTIFVQENKSFEDVRRELEGRNPVLELDPSLIDGAKSFSDFPKFPLETLQSSADDLPEEVDKTHREVRITLYLHFTLKKFTTSNLFFHTTTDYWPGTR